MTNIIRDLIYTPIYSAYCLNISIFTFYPVILRYCSATLVLSAIFLGVNDIVKINSWIGLFILVILCGFIGLIVNFIILFNKNEKIIFVKTCKKFILKFSQSNFKNESFLEDC